MGIAPTTYAIRTMRGRRDGRRGDDAPQDRPILAAACPIALATKILRDAIKDFYRRSVRRANNEHLVSEMPSITYSWNWPDTTAGRAMEELEVSRRSRPCACSCTNRGLSYAQIAKNVDITEVAARANVSRGRRQLTDLLRPDLPRRKGLLMEDSRTT
uniref:RNA polymerase subunit sigma n=1 Tax=Streptomyces sp. S501 TaxID=2420135 RepID=UPI001F0E16B0|nr:RNA polymerase subunit sigma [Streptomyces sp. S501]